jgi:hypothetical protein
VPNTKVKASGGRSSLSTARSMAVSGGTDAAARDIRTHYWDIVSVIIGGVENGDIRAYQGFLEGLVVSTAWRFGHRRLAPGGTPQRGRPVGEMSLKRCRLDGRS